MNRSVIGWTLGLLTILAPLAPAADAPAPSNPREALRPFGHFVGTWRCTGHPEGTREEKQRGFWQESFEWAWKFKGDDAWLTVEFRKGKYFTKGELHYRPKTADYELRLETVGKETLVFAGPLKERRLLLDRTDAKTKETQRLAVTLLHPNRFLYHYEVNKDGPDFTRLYQVGATKEGVPFANAGSNDPECVVSGGRGTIKVTHKGETYYVCCGGCRDAFTEDPDKWIAEFKKRKAEKK